MTARPPLDREVAGRFLKLTDPWMSCDRCFEDQDGVVDDLVSSGALPSEAFLVHMGACPACLDETRSLVALVAEQDGADSDALLRRLDSAIEVASP